MMATTTAAFTVQPPRSRLSYAPWLPLILGVGAIICTGVWHHFASLALYDTKVIAALISIKAPKAFSSVLPSLMSATVALVVIFIVLAWATYALRALQQYSYNSSSSSGRNSSKHSRLLLIASGVVNSLLYILTVWFMVMFAISLLWAGGGMIAAKATMDGANTLTVIDDTLPKLIKTAVGIDPAKTGYLVHVAGRDVNIGKSSCSLFCFTLARAMLADTIDCTCNADLAQQMLPASGSTPDINSQVCQSTPVMCSINAYAYSLFHSHMAPAVAAIVIATLCVLGMLQLMSGTFSRLLAEQRCGYISRSSSADVHMRVDGDSSPGATPQKGMEV
eukprot:GHUV01000150.1.p2 GENE.GHUV01000150.1~~GHUV01000150.1.p2  ORF type:complete len:334 (+),score=70.47 GHUV01000150.1:273-1274(+)